MPTCLPFSGAIWATSRPRPPRSRCRSPRSCARQAAWRRGGRPARAPGRSLRPGGRRRGRRAPRSDLGRRGRDRAGHEGTSCDVCVVERGRVRQIESRAIAGRVIQLPMVDVHTVGAGRGSERVARPRRSASHRTPLGRGADPGPACRRGGTEPTVTDAGQSSSAGWHWIPRLPGVSRWTRTQRAGRWEPRRRARAERNRDGGSIVRLANQEMARALRVVTVERGVDPERFALLPFGGAGPMHAAELAEEGQITRLLCRAPAASWTRSGYWRRRAAVAPRPRRDARARGDDGGADRRRGPLPCAGRSVRGWRARRRR